MRGIVIIEHIVVKKSVFAAKSWFVLYASAIKIVEIALGVPACKTRASTSSFSNLKTIVVK